MEELIEKVKSILDGIDKEEYYDDNGWWETSDGAKFGKGKLEEVLTVIKESYDVV